MFTHAQPEVTGCLPKLDHLSLEQVKALGDTALAGVLRRIVDNPESQSQDPVAAFSNYI